MRPYELATGAAIVLIAFVAMVDSFRKAGWTSVGPDSGFYPFWSAVAMALAGVAVLAQAWRAPLPGRGVFESRAGALALIKLVVPLVGAVALISPLGLYIVSGGYMALFARVGGRYSWIATLALAIGVPLALYFGFEQAFRFSLPKSALYRYGALPI